MLRTTFVLASAIVFCGMSCAATVAAEEREIDTARSVLKIRVFKSGIFSGFAHDHEIEAPVAEGTVRVSTDPSVTLRVHAGELRVLDPELSPGKREDVQRTMEGSEVLDIKRFPEISFESTAVQKKDEQHWTVRGNLTLHGQASPVEVDVVEKDGHYQGSAKLRQHVFGITPIAVAGGTVKVKDEVKIEFDIVLK
jgi:polyisoprenoid-binding protein YceI